MDRIIKMKIFEVEENHWRCQYGEFGLDIVLLFSESWVFWSKNGELFKSCLVGVS